MNAVPLIRPPSKEKTMHACPYCASEDIGIIDVLGRIYSVGCRSCGMSGPQEATVEAAELAWNGLCLKICSHCVSRPWGRALARRMQEMAKAQEKTQSPENCEPSSPVTP